MVIALRPRGLSDQGQVCPAGRAVVLVGERLDRPDLMLEQLLDLPRAAHKGIRAGTLWLGIWEGSQAGSGVARASRRSEELRSFWVGSLLA